MNFRMQVTSTALRQVSEHYADQPLHIIEVGCMFRETEGLSTYAIAALLAERPAGGRFVSIEYDQSHIEVSQQIMQRRAPELSDYVEYYHGHSLAMLPQALNRLGTVHFVSLDGGAHPEVCLVEFELVQSHLAPAGVILVDDVHQLEVTQHYALPRPMGKATLILPMLTLQNYLQHRPEFLHANTAPGYDVGVPDSAFLKQLPPEIMSDQVNHPFRLLYNPKGQHMILAYGDLAFLNTLESGKKPRAPLVSSSTKAPAVAPKPPTNAPQVVSEPVKQVSPPSHTMYLDIESWPFLPRIRRKFKLLLIEIPFLRPIFQKRSFFD